MLALYRQYVPGAYDARAIREVVCHEAAHVQTGQPEEHNQTWAAALAACMERG
jgi:hypothetical protein